MGPPRRPRRGDAAGGYPLSPKKDLITCPPGPTDEVVVFHAGTVAEDDQVKTAGGRVLCVTALADSVKQAQTKAYECCARHPL